MLTLPYHVEFLRRELADRQERNARYSMRAFASLLDVHPSALSRILTGKQTLSLKSAVLVIKKLQLEGDERLQFARSLVRSRHREFCSDLCLGVDGSISLADLLPDEASQTRSTSGTAGGEVVHFLPQPTWLFDRAGYVVRANQHLLDQIGLGASEALSMRDLLDADDWNAFEESWKLALQLGRSFEIQIRFASTLGEGNVNRAPQFMQVFPMRDEARTIVHWLATTNDAVALPVAATS